MNPEERLPFLLTCFWLVVPPALILAAQKARLIRRLGLAVPFAAACLLGLSLAPIVQSFLRLAV